MPYYWQRVLDLYQNHPDEGWANSPGAIVGDLAWHFIDADDTPSALQTAVYEADDGEGEWREPYPDEECRFKTWIDDMTRSEVTQGWRDNLLKCVFASDEQHTISSAEASTILHMAPCSVIQDFIEKTQKSIDEFNQSEASYDSNNTEETIIVQSEDRDGRQSPFVFHGFGLANRPNSDSEDSDSDSDSDSDDSMPELESEEQQEDRELRTNQWDSIRFNWQNWTTPRQYFEIMEGNPYDGVEDMEISDSEEDDLPPLSSLAPPPGLTRQVACVLPRA